MTYVLWPIVAYHGASLSNPKSTLAVDHFHGPPRLQPQEILREVRYTPPLLAQRTAFVLRYECGCGEMYDV